MKCHMRHETMSSVCCKNCGERIWWPSDADHLTAAIEAEIASVTRRRDALQLILARTAAR